MSAEAAARDVAPDHDSRDLRIHSVRKSYGGVAAISSISCTIEHGAVTAIIGPNGAGKTTLFNVISGYTVPDEGSVWYGDTRLTGLEPYQIARNGVGRTFQDARPFVGLTVRDNLLVAAAAAEQAGLRRSILRPFATARRSAAWWAKADQTLDFVGLTRFAEVYPSALSGGQVKALAIARLLMLDATLLLLDEPTAGLDPGRVELITDLVSRLSKAGKTVVLVEHRLSFVSEISHHVICIASGRVLAEGSVADVLGSNAVREAYVGV